MPARIEGYITVDAADYADDLEIHADADDIAEIMDANNIDMDDMMEYFDVSKEVRVSDIEDAIKDGCDTDDLIRIVNCCMTRLVNDYKQVFKNMCDKEDQIQQKIAEAKVLTGGPHVSEVRPSS
jgi:hypothetical protein